MRRLLVEDWRKLAGRLLPAVVFIACLAGYCWHNDFAYFYHTDEESKTLQVLQHYRNFWHPLLLVNMTDWLASLFGMATDAQTITHCGRYFSAFCGATAVTAMTVLALRRHGLAMAAMLALFTGTLPLLFEISHYFKEDSALLMGMTLALLAMDFCLEKFTAGRVVFLGVTCGLVLSAKYIGAVVPPIALAMVLWKGCRLHQWRLIGWFVAAFLVTSLVLDWQWVNSASAAFKGLGRETALLQTGQNGLAGSVIGWPYGEILLNNLGRWMLVVALAGGIGSLVGRSWEKLEAGMMLFAICFYVGLITTGKTSDRYLLPVILICLYFFCLGLTRLCRWLGGSWGHWGRWGRWGNLSRILLPVVTLICWWPQKTMLGNYVREFRRDSRADLTAWIQDNLPVRTHVATSLWTRLPGYYWEQVQGAPPPLDFVADSGTLADLQRSGIRQVVVADAEWERFLQPDQSVPPSNPGANAADVDFQRRKQFYTDLFATSRLLWKKERGRVYILHPGLRLYELPE